MSDDKKIAVITGASSGIGMATALKFAEADYNVVLAARRKKELDIVAKECQAFGIETLSVVTDITDEHKVSELSRMANNKFGHIDVWVNNAGVYLTGKFEDLPLEDMRRVMDTNFFGTLHGSYVALKQFKKQQAGVLINISSVNATAPQPYISIYSASKAAIRAFDESLRMELRMENLQDDIHICTVMPAAIDTNLFKNSANYTGKALRAPQPVYDPDYVASQIVSLAKRPRRELVIGSAGKLMAFQKAHQPKLFERHNSRYTAHDLLSDEPVAYSDGNLYQVSETHGERGGWQEKRLSGKQLNRAAAGAGLATLIGAAGVGYYAVKQHTNKTKLDLLSR
jgi:short-subunit dehydrogenase